MNIAEKAQEALNQGFLVIANQFALPSNFPPQVVAETESITQGLKDGIPDFLTGRLNVTEIPLVTLDPAPSTDLDQAFAIEQDGDELVLHYALADGTLELDNPQTVAFSSKYSKSSAIDESAFGFTLNAISS